MKGCCPWLAGQSPPLYPNIDFFEGNVLVICDRSDGERNSTSESTQNQLDRATVSSIVYIASGNCKKTAPGMNFCVSINKAHMRIIFSHYLFTSALYRHP
jgi:hypothetical protein